MARTRVPLHQRPGYVDVDPGATDGAVIGGNLRLPDGTVPTVDMLLNPPVAPAERYPITIWRRVLEVPPNVVALANTVGTGLYALTAAGASATRAIIAFDGELTVLHGSGVEGDPKLGLADVADTGGGLLQRLQFDAKGRKTGSSAATTDDLDEGVTNRYHTDRRALDAVGAGLVNSPSVTWSINPTTGLITATAIGGGGGGGAVDSVNGEVGAVVLDTDDIDEGVSNRYFTAERAVEAVGAALEGGGANDVGLTITDGVISATIVPITSADVYGAADKTLRIAVNTKGQVTQVDELDIAGGGGGGLGPRASLTVANGTGTIPVGKVATLLDIRTTAPARCRLYATNAARAADSGRAAGIPPPQGAGLLLEFISVGALLGAPLTPGIVAYNLDDPVDGNIYYNIVSASGFPLNVTLTYLTLES